MMKEQAMEYLKKAAEHVEHLRNMRKIEYEGKQVFCVGPSDNEVHMYDNHVFIDMAKALDLPIVIDTNYDNKNGNGQAWFNTTIDGYGEQRWTIFTLFKIVEGWPNDK